MMQLPKKQITFWSVALAVFLLGMFMWWYTDDIDKLGLQERQVGAIDNKIKIKADTIIEQTFFYSKCKDKEVVKIKPDKSLIGLDYSSFQERYAKWNIEMFNDKKVIMSLQVDDYCREHKANMFLGINDGYVAVFYGKPGPKAILKEMTKISVGNLQSQALKELEKGLFFSSKAEMLYILEGMQSK